MVRNYKMGVGYFQQRCPNAGVTGAEFEINGEPAEVTAKVTFSEEIEADQVDNAAAELGMMPFTPE